MKDNILQQEDKEYILDDKFKVLEKLVLMFMSYYKLFCAESQPIKLYPYMGKSENIEKNSMELKCSKILNMLAVKLNFQSPIYYDVKPHNINCIDAAINRVLRFEQAEWSYLSQYENLDLEHDLNGIAYPSVMWDTIELTTSDGLLFTAYYKGDPRKKTVVFVPPCGMPVEAFSASLEMLKKHYFVLTWESPFLFHKVPPTREWSIEDDIQCIAAMIEFFKCSRINLIGICGGVPIAVVAAAVFKEQVVSLCSCHGDIYFGKESPMTLFKKQFLDFTQSSIGDEIFARDFYELLLDPALLLGVEEMIAPYIVYPYLSFNLFMKYAEINSQLMTLDLTAYVERLTCHLLVISSEDDRIAHPDVSSLLYQKVPEAEMWMREHGEHYDVIAGDVEVYKRIMKEIGGD